MAYWIQVAWRAWREAAKTAKLDSRKLLMALVLGQIVNGLIIYLILGSDKLPDNIVARCATIAAPFVLFVPFFFFELILAPAKMHAEQASELDRARADLAKVLQTSASAPIARDSIILNPQEENALLRDELSAVKWSTEADYPFDARQRAALVSILSQTPLEARSPVAVFHAGFLGGNSDYARRMVRAFRDAGWEAQAYPDYFIQPTNEGIYLATLPDEDGKPSSLPPLGQIVHKALEKADVKHKLALRTPDSDTDTEWRFFVF